MLRKFFCFDLYATGLLVGWLGLAESITNCITSILALENVDTIIIPNITNGTNTTDVRSTIVGLLSSNIGLNIIDLLASGLLIAGTIKRNHLLLLPWLINTTFSLSFNLIVLALATVLVASSSSPEQLSFLIVVLVFLFVGFGIYLYVFAAIYSLYHHIKRAMPNSEYSSLIEDRNAKGHPIYTRC